jgi:hypothetical protein
VRSDVEQEAAPVMGAEAPRRQEASQHVGVLVRAATDTCHHLLIVPRHNAHAREDAEGNVGRNGPGHAYARHRSFHLEHDHLLPAATRRAV